MRYLRLVEGARVTRIASGADVVTCGVGTEVGLGEGPIGALLPGFLAGTEPLEVVVRSVFEAAGPNGVEDFIGTALRLDAAGLLETELRAGEEVLARKTPLLPGRSGPLIAEPQAGADVRLCRHAFLRPVGDQLVLESPLSGFGIGVAGQALAWLADLARGPTSVGLGLIGEDARAGFVGLLARAGMTEPVGGEDHDRSWEFHDLLFHARSRFGRHLGRYGGRDQVRPEPSRHRPMPVLASTSLAEPAAEPGSGPDLFTVLRERRSVREHGRVPITLRQLGLFLHHAARARPDRSVRNSWGESPVRPYPSGGAAYELGLYPLVSRCEGAPPGLHRYDPLHHRLDHLMEPCPALDRLLDDARAGWGTAQHPQILIVVTAEFERLYGRYSSMAYAAILKNVGVLYQTMYLVATGLGLAPCALGGGNADGFARATGLDYLVEGSVGEFALGNADRT